MGRSGFGKGPCRLCLKRVSSAGFASHAHDQAHAALGDWRVSGKSRYAVDEFAITDQGRARMRRTSALRASGEIIGWYADVRGPYASADRLGDDGFHISFDRKRSWRVERTRLDSKHFAWVVVNEALDVAEVLWDVPRGEKEPVSRQLQRMIHAANDYVHDRLPASAQYQPEVQ